MRESAVEDSFVSGLLDCPHYTRPEEYEGLRVPVCCFPATTEDSSLAAAKQSLARTCGPSGGPSCWRTQVVKPRKKPQLLAEIVKMPVSNAVSKFRI